MHAKQIVFPADARAVIDVTKAPYGLDPTGRRRIRSWAAEEALAVGPEAVCESGRAEATTISTRYGH